MKENSVFIQTEKSKRQHKECKINWEERTYFGASSGTEPLLRVMVEGESEAEIQELANYVADVIREQLV
ncbi:MAG: hypothetical protein ACLRRA_03645 [Acutalibacteraceae bacterium]